ncbi:MAG TPA: hypothetical protein PLA68_16240, partial [Panacibacter sp.]|nr:hypothetical protein [Panacibacter sp.]
SDAQWPMFSSKIAKWLFLCEYYPFRMSWLVQSLISNHQDRTNRNDREEIQSMSVSEFALSSPEPSEAGDMWKRSDFDPEMFHLLLSSSICIDCTDVLNKNPAWSLLS